MMKQFDKPRKIQFTQEGYEKMKIEFEGLTEKRKGAVIALRTAREMGDLSENGAYKAARWELSGIDRELRKLTYLLKMARVVERTNEGIVDFGRKITIDDGGNHLTFTLVSSFESDPVHNKLSEVSPIGKAVKGRHVGEEVSVSSPNGIRKYTIVNIE